MENATGAVRAEDPSVRRVLEILQGRIGPQRFNAWFARGARMTIQDGQVKVAVTNPFIANWIESHYHAEIASAAQAETGRPQTVVITIDPALAGEVRRSQLDHQADLVSKETQGRARPRTAAGPPPLRHRLEDFVVGQSNKLAYSAALAVAGGKKPPFSPLFVHGPCGVGKTHLLQGICNSVSRVRRGGVPLAWRYVTGEQFTNEFIVALRQKRFSEFRDRYRKLDLLAIDDVHFLAAKKATQDEFLHTFNAIESAGRQIVMASDAHPRLVGQLNEQLISRFVSGMVVKIDVPDQATRMAIVRRKARGMNLRAGEEILEYIAVHVRGSVRELEGTLIKLAALATLENGKVTLSLATQALADHLSRAGSAVTLGDIEAAVAAYFGITPADIHSSRRTRTISVARMVAMFMARRHTSMSYPEIGRAMGKNHSSVVLSVQRMQSLISQPQELTWTTPAGDKSMPADKLLELLSDQIA